MTCPCQQDGTAFRGMRVGALPLALIAEGLTTAGAVSNAHAISRWAASRLPPAPGTYGDAHGSHAGGYVSSGGSYHRGAQPAARVGSVLPARSTPRAVEAAGGSAWARSRARRRGVIVGQIVATTDDLQARVTSLDTDWNALATAVCGSARSATCTGPVATQLGASWVQGFQTSLAGWRTYRDGFRQRWMTWGISDGHDIDRWRDELARYTADVQRVTGHAPVAPPQEAPPSALDQLAHAAGDAARNAGSSFGAVAGVGLLVLGAFAFAKAR